MKFKANPTIQRNIQEIMPLRIQPLFLRSDETMRTT